MKLLFTRPIRNRSSIPLESFVSSLFPFIAFYPFRIGNNNANITFFKDVKHVSPILFSGFYTDIQAVVFQKPIFKTVQVRIEGTESFFLIVWLQAVCGNDDGSNHKCFVNIYTAESWEYDFHKPPCQKMVRRMWGLNRQAINRC